LNDVNDILAQVSVINSVIIPPLSETKNTQKV